MKKKVFQAILVLAFAGLIGCSSKEKVSVEIEDNSDIETEVVEVTEEKIEEQPVVIESGTAPTAAANVNPNYLSLNDAGIMAEGILLNVGDDFKANVEKVGEAEIEEGQACLDDGFDTNYYYGDDALTVYTYASDGQQIIYDIFVQSKDYATVKGVAVGNTKDDVIAAYGDPNESSNVSFKYYVENDNTVLSFDFNSDGTVKDFDLLRNN